MIRVPFSFFSGTFAAIYSMAFFVALFFYLVKIQMLWLQLQNTKDACYDSLNVIRGVSMAWLVYDYLSLFVVFFILMSGGAFSLMAMLMDRFESPEY